MKSQRGLLWALLCICALAIGAVKADKKQVLCDTLISYEFTIGDSTDESINLRKTITARYNQGWHLVNSVTACSGDGYICQTTLIFEK